MAQLLDSTVISVNSALQRARASLERGPHRSEMALAQPSADVEGQLVGRYIATWEASDIDGFVALLKEDAVLRMPPWQQWYRGRDAIRTFFASIPQPPNPGWGRVLATRANGQPAFAHYQLDPDAALFRANTIQVVTTARDGVAVLTAFVRNVALFRRFDLPDTLPRATD
jgi:RNA polymerase sigma-70 factor, ECF subfamily